MGLGTRTENGDHLSAPNWSCPFLANEVKLVSVPELDYYAHGAHPKGEICIRGTSVFSGYYKDEEATKEVLDANGWLHSGDIGEMDQFGRIRVIDRIKNIFKLSQGEFVSSELVEDAIRIY